MSEKILAWFEKRREIRALQLMGDHLKLATGAVEELAKAVNSKIKKDEKQCNESINRLSRMEEEADELRRDIALELSKGEIPPAQRDDLLHLLRRVDWIADWARESGRILAVAPLEKAPASLTDLCVGMMETTTECVSAVRKCLDGLGKNLKESLELADKVERLEESIDEQYNEARRYYALLDFQRVNPGEAILLAQLLDAIENIADWCENTVDQVRVIAVRFM